jgi:hypothetical protein
LYLKLEDGTALWVVFWSDLKLEVNWFRVGHLLKERISFSPWVTSILLYTASPFTTYINPLISCNRLNDTIHRRLVNGRLVQHLSGTRGKVTFKTRTRPILNYNKLSAALV